jgi:hypothetical protein
VHVAPDHRIILKRSRGRRIVGRGPHWLALVRKYGAKGYASEKHRDSDQPYYAVVSGRNKSLRFHLRLVAAELQMATIRTGVYIQGADFMAVWKEGKDLKDISYLQTGVKDMLDQLIWWTKALKAARDRDRIAAAAA